MSSLFLGQSAKLVARFALAPARFSCQISQSDSYILDLLRVEHRRFAQGSAYFSRVHAACPSGLLDRPFDGRVVVRRVNSVARLNGLLMSAFAMMLKQATIKHAEAR